MDDAGQIESFGGGAVSAGYATARQGGTSQPTGGGDSGVTAPPPPLSFDGGATFQPGVDQLQRALVQAGYLAEGDRQSGPGFYGEKTRAAVARLQQAAGISSPDGRSYGPRTQAALSSRLAQVQRPSVETADAEIRDKINPARGSMDPVLAAQLSAMSASPTYEGAAPAGSPNGPVFFKSFNLDPQGHVNNPDAQVYSYRRDDGHGGWEWATFEVVGGFSHAYASIDPGRAGTNSALGLPTSGREMMGDGPYAGLPFQNFENGQLVQTDPGSASSPAKFTWLDGAGNVVKADFETSAVDLG